MSYMLYNYFPFHLYMLGKDNKKHRYLWGNSRIEFHPKEEEDTNP
jgi:hypothetical protein